MYKDILASPNSSSELSSDSVSVKRSVSGPGGSSVTSAAEVQSEDWVLGETEACEIRCSPKPLSSFFLSSIIPARACARKKKKKSIHVYLPLYYTPSHSLITTMTLLPAPVRHEYIVCISISGSAEVQSPATTCNRSAAGGH